MESLNEFIQDNPDSRELKRGDAERLTFASRKGTGGRCPRAVKMVEHNYSFAQISKLLGVSLGFISNYRQQFLNHGIEGLRLKYKGSKGYLSSLQKQKIIDWLQQKDNWQLSELQTQVEVEYGVVFASLQSYYSLFAEAGISWKKTQKSNPRKNPELVNQKKMKLRHGWKRIEKKSNQVD